MPKQPVAEEYSVVTIQYSPSLTRQKGLKTATKNKIQSGCMILAAAAAIASAFYARSASNRADTQDASAQWNEKIDARIATSGKLGTIQASLDRIENRLSTLEGWKEGITSQVKIIKQAQDAQDKAITAQQALNRLQDPTRILATIQAELRLAGIQRKVLPPMQLADYRNAVRAIPISANQYWTTIAAIINYQSLVNQIAGKAPDPASVARPCVAFTNDPNHHVSGNTYSGGVYRNCVVDLDANEFRNLTFVNSVIRYGGAPNTILQNVTFENCRFVLSTPNNPVPPQRDLLLALLDRGDESKFSVSR